MDDDSGAQQPQTTQPNPHGWRRAVDYVNRRLQERATNRNTETPQDRAARRTVGATWVMVVVTAVTAVVGFLQWLILRGTLEEMRNQQRAWISFEITPRSAFVVKNGASAIFDVKVTNQGQTPALNLQSHARLMAIPYTGKGGAPYGPGDCEAAKPDSYHGISVFPKESTTLRTALAPISQKSIDAETQNGAVVFLLEVCVDYFSGDGAARHRTQNEYLIAHHWFPQKDKYGLIMPQRRRYDFNASLAVDVIDFDHFGAGEKAY